MMLKSWFSSKSSSTSKHSSQPPQAQTIFPSQDAQSAQQPPKDAVTVKDTASQSTLERHQTIASTQSGSDIPLADINVHAHINDPSTYTASTNAGVATAEADLLRSYSVEGDGTTSKESNALPTGEEKNTRPREQIIENSETLFTPHDAIFAAVFGRPTQTTQGPSQPQTSTAGTSDPTTATNANYTHGLSASLLSDSSAQAASNGFIPSLQLPAPTVTLYDPFSGARLGEHTPTSPKRDNTVSSAHFPPPGDPELWAHLERILELQAEISGLHAEMEGVGTARGTMRGTGEGGGAAGLGTKSTSAAAAAEKSARSRHSRRRPSARSQTMPIGDEDDVGPSASDRDNGNITDSSSDTSSHGPGGHVDEDDEDDVHGFGKRKREEEFSRLATQFKERKVAIDGIMNKLDDLSSALQTFHALPMPHLDLGSPASRTNTMSSSTSGASRGSTSSPPYQSMSFSPPASPFTVPPISPPLRPAAGSGLGVVPPLVTTSTSSAPQRTAQLPAKIIAEAEHVDSPIDMHPTQSAFAHTNTGKKEQ